MKLLRVVANNFRLCEDNFEISFVPVANKTEDDKEFELKEIDEDLYIFNTLCVIGKNASGKTTSVELLSVVYDILTNFKIKSSLNTFKFIDNRVSLDITFYHEGSIYRYITELVKDSYMFDDSVILFENEKLMMRKYKKTHSRDLFDYSKYVDITYNKDKSNDSSLLYFLLNKINIRGIYCSSDDSMYKYFNMAFNIYRILNNGISLIPKVLKMFDSHIDNIEMIDDGKFLVTYKDKTSKKLDNNDLYDVLSSGTTKGFCLFTFVIYSLINGVDLIVDEIENHFHKNLVENLVNLYKDKTVNKKCATLIFTTHYCELLDLFSRSDNIYISKYENKIYLENMYSKYKLRPDISKSNKFYNNEFNTNVNYDALMDFKKELM